jgi:emp24/gp25L/p24 family/GOLD
VHDSLASAEQVHEMKEGLQRLDVIIDGIEREQRHLAARATRHLKTVQSTHTRALFYCLGINAMIVVASVAQVWDRQTDSVPQVWAAAPAGRARSQARWARCPAVSASPATMSRTVWRMGRTDRQRNRQTDGRMDG